MRKKLLLTAFEPFDGETRNPSLEVVRALDRSRWAGVDIDVLELPVERFHAIDLALHHLHRTVPDVVVMLGEAGRRLRITPERVAINVDDFAIPDNAGQQPQGEPIMADGPVGYFATLPIYQIVKRLLQANIPAAISNSAGTYLCNRLFYSVMHCLAVEQWPSTAGFIHLPYLHEQTVHKRPEVASLSRETMLAAVYLALDVALQARAPLHLPAGSITTPI
jgi:pyroglutamyl-peptidase